MICKKCNEDKEIEEFRKGRKQCKSCEYKINKENWYKNHAERLAQKREYYQNNKEKIQSWNKQYKQTWYRENKERLAILMKEYYNTHKDIIVSQGIEYRKNRSVIDSLFCLTEAIRHTISNAIRFCGYKKSSHTYNLLKCEYEFFMLYLGDKPEGKVHLDHICPCAQAQNEEELIKLQHYSNFRWMKAEDNIKKGCKPTPEAVFKCKQLLNREWEKGEDNG